MGIYIFPARNWRAAALLQGRFCRGTGRWLSGKRGPGNEPGGILSEIGNPPSRLPLQVRYRSFRGVREGCSQLRLFQAPITCFSGSNDTVTRKNDTIVWGDARFSLRLTGIYIFPARNWRAAALLQRRFCRGRDWCLLRKSG